LGLKIHICAHAGVRFKLVSNRSPKEPISIGETKDTEAARITVSENFMMESRQAGECVGRYFES